MSCKKVKKILLIDYNLTGTINSFLNKLVNPTVLHIYKNNLFGPIGLAGNKISGVIPNLSSLTNLRYWKAIN